MATPQETPIDTNSAFQAIQENFSDLTNSSIDPLWLANHLFTNNVITLQQKEDATYETFTTRVKLDKLLTLVIKAVYEDGNVYTTLMNILSTEEGYKKWIEKINNSYQRIYRTQPMLIVPAGLISPVQCNPGSAQSTLNQDSNVTGTYTCVYILFVQILQY